MKHRLRVSGYSLIELMIAMFLGLFILAGITQINLSSKKTYQITNFSASLQEDLRAATYELTKIARIAGYKSSPSQTNINSFVPDKIFTSAGQVIVGNEGGTPLDPDSFSLRFQGSGDGNGVPDSVITDCIGNALDANDIAVITFDIDQGSLRCTSQNETTADTQTIKLVKNVDNMQVLYGIDTDNDNYANRYINATKVTASALWQNVVSLRVALLLKSNKEIYSFKDDKSITLNDITIPAKNDRYMRMQSVSTITMRNVLP